MAEFDTKAQCAEWIERQLVQRQAEIAPPKAPSVTDSDLQRGYARLLGTKVNANCAQVDPATGATTWATLAERARPELADQCASLPFENGWQAEQAAKTVDESFGAAGQLMRLHAARSEGCASTHSVPPRSRRNTGRGGFGVPEPRRVESGGWRVQVTTFDGCRRSRTFPTRSEANQWANNEVMHRECLRREVARSEPQTLISQAEDMEHHARSLRTAAERMRAAASLRSGPKNCRSVEHRKFAWLGLQASLPGVHAKSSPRPGEDHARLTSSANRSGEPAGHLDGEHLGASASSANGTSVSEVNHG